MPTPREGENKDEWIKRCVPVVIEDGTAEDGDQAVAICNSIWEREMKTKEGNIHEAETLIAWGGAVKALGDGKIGGYLVRFTT